MKIIWRTLIILLAAAVVTGATLGAMQLPAVQSWIGSRGGESHGPPGMAAGEFTGDEAAEGVTAFAAPTGEESDASAAASSATADATARPMRGEGGERGGHNGGNLAGLVEVAKNLGIVVVFSLVIAAAGWVARRVRPHRRQPAAAA